MLTLTVHQNSAGIVCGSHTYVTSVLWLNCTYISEGNYKLSPLTGKENIWQIVADKPLQASLQTKSEKKQKSTENQAQELPPELAEIVTIWHELPEHIKAAIKALVQTHSKGTK